MSCPSTILDRLQRKEYLTSTIGLVQSLSVTLLGPDKIVTIRNYHNNDQNHPRTRHFFRKFEEIAHAITDLYCPLLFAHVILM